MDENEFVRMEALAGLGRIDDPRVLPLLMASLDDPAPRVRRSAVEALSPDHATRESKDMPAVRAALLRALGDEDMEVRRASADAFGRLRDGGAIDALIAALDDPEPWVREQVVRALGAIGQKRAIPALRGLESDPDSTVRHLAEMAARALGRSGR